MRNIKSVTINSHDLPGIWSGVKLELKKLPYEGNVSIRSNAVCIFTLKLIDMFKSNMLEVCSECEELFPDDPDLKSSRNFLEKLKGE